MQRLYKNLFLSQRPETFISQGDTENNVVYNHNIVAGQETQEGEIIEGFHYDCLIVPYPLTANNILATMLSELYPVDMEQKLQNDYNAVALLIEPTEKKQAYIDYLTARKALRQMIDADCTTLNIPLG